MFMKGFTDWVIGSISPLVFYFYFVEIEWQKQKRERYSPVLVFCCCLLSVLTT